MKLSEYAFPSLFPSVMEHQKKTVEFMVRNPRCYNLSGLGSTKTISSAWSCDFLRINNKIRTVLVICPLSTVYSAWLDTLWKHLPHRESVALVGSRAKRLEALKKDAMFYVINHDGIKCIKDELIKKKFDIVICDEITAFATHTSQRSKVAYEITRHAKGVYGLTGTPTSNNVLSAYGIARIVNPHNPNLPRSFYKYRDSVCQLGYDGFTWVKKDGAEKIVADILSPSICFRTRDVVDMPEVIHINRDVSMSKDVMDVYTKVKKDMMYEFSDNRITAVNAAAKIVKLLQCSAGGVIAESGEVVPLDMKPKIKEIIALYDENGQTPAIISATFTNTINVLYQELKKKYRVEYVDGSRTGAARGAIIREFQEGKLDFLIIHPKSCAHGLNLQNSNLIINVSPVLSNEVAQQLYGRISRPGQTRVQIIANLISTPTEKRFYKALQDKQVMSDIIMAEFTA